MIKKLFTILFLTILSAGLESFNKESPIQPKDVKVLSVSFEKDAAFIKPGYIPQLDTMYMVGKKYMGKWINMFLAVKIEESGNDHKNSYLAEKYHNLVGMRFPKSRRSYAIASTNTNYAIYRNWFECMLDFKIYMENMENSFFEKNKRNFKNDREVVEYMSSRYNYFDKWKNDMLALTRKMEKRYGKAF